MLKYIAMFLKVFLAVFVIAYLLILILQGSWIFLILMGFAAIIATQFVCTLVLINTIKDKNDAETK